MGWTVLDLRSPCQGEAFCRLRSLTRGGVDLIGAVDVKVDGKRKRWDGEIGMGMLMLMSFLGRQQKVLYASICPQGGRTQTAMRVT